MRCKSFVYHRAPHRQGPTRGMAAHRLSTARPQGTPVWLLGSGAATAGQFRASSVPAAQPASSVDSAGRPTALRRSRRQLVAVAAQELERHSWVRLGPGGCEVDGRVCGGQCFHVAQRLAQRQRAVAQQLVRGVSRWQSGDRICIPAGSDTSFSHAKKESLYAEGERQGA